MGIHKDVVAFLTLVTWQEVVPLIGNKKSHYYSIKINITVPNIPPGVSTPSLVLPVSGSLWAFYAGKIMES